MDELCHAHICTTLAFNPRLAIVAIGAFPSVEAGRGRNNNRGEDSLEAPESLAGVKIAWSAPARSVRETNRMLIYANSPTIIPLDLPAGMVGGTGFEPVTPAV